MTDPVEKNPYMAPSKEPPQVHQHLAAADIEYDPYALPPEDIQEPPKTLFTALQKIGPGIILAGTIVGSGELLLTTSLGAKQGFVFLWLILFS
jgi:hypothetical protein